MRRSVPIFSATVARLLFFGSRYVSLLLVARLLGENASGFLLAVAIVEVMRIIFDYGLENSVLGRLHQQKSGPALVFATGKKAFRWYATLLGQLATSALVGILCARNETPLLLPLIASLQFGCLMGFGYLQAHLQTGRQGGMAALVLPLALATAVQALLLWLAYSGLIPFFWCTICFELMALVACASIVRRFGENVPATVSSDLSSTSHRAVFLQIAPLGNVALLGIAYNRFDSFALSLVASGALLTQYLVYQRLASAPLMFFSTVASASISTLSVASSDPDELPRKIARYRQIAYGLAFVSGIILCASSPLINRFFSLQDIHYGVMVTQSIVLALQIANGFHASMLIACRKIDALWHIAKKNAIAALIVLPAATWIWGGIGIAVGLCLVEAYCAIQHAFEFRKKPRLPEAIHA